MKASARVIVLVGPSGAGKTSVGKRLAAALGWPFVEGDALHPPANIAKMRSGVPLTDADRATWLGKLRARIERHLATGRSAVVACSALKESYRARLRVGPAVRFVYLKTGPDVLERRLRQRVGHYMKHGMLPSQLAALEEPADALTVDATRPMEDLVSQIIEVLGLAG